MTSEAVARLAGPKLQKKQLELQMSYFEPNVFCTLQPRRSSYGFHLQQPRPRVDSRPGKKKGRWNGTLAGQVNYGSRFHAPAGDPRQSLARSFENSRVTPVGFTESKSRVHSVARSCLQHVTRGLKSS